MPGVESAAAVLIRPLSGTVGWDTTYTIDGESPERPNARPNGNYEAISPAYFRTMGIRLLAGRDLADSGTASAPGVVIIDENTARRRWPRGDAVVAGAVRYREWQAPWPDFYVPYAQRAQHRTDFVVKTKDDPRQFANAVRREILAIDRNQPITDLTTMQELVDRTLSGARFNSIGMAALAACALLLAAIGIYAVLSYSVTLRRAEIGVRIALGATPAAVARRIGKQALIAVWSGGVAGLLAAVWLRTALARLVFGIAAVGPLAYGLAAIALTVVAVASSVLPSWRAASIDPARALHGR